MGKSVEIEINRIISEVINSFELLKKDERVEFARVSHPTKMKILGVTNPDLKTVLKELRLKLKNFSKNEKYSLIISLFKTDIFECQHLALQYLGTEKKFTLSLTEPEIDLLNYQMDNWISVDCFAGFVMGVAWRENIVSTKKIKKLLRSNDVWQRRIGLVSTIALNQKARGGIGDSERTLEICELVIDDHADMMNKALSWSLRELSKIEKQPVIDFMEKYENRLHKRVKREVWNKIETGRKFNH